MINIKLIISLVFISFFLIIAIFNLKVAWRNFFQKKRGPSEIPIIGGIFGAISLYLFPHIELKSFFWLPIMAPSDWTGITCLFIQFKENQTKD